MIKLTYIDKNGVSKNITPVTANYTRSDNIESLGMQLSFDLLNNPLDTNYNKNRLEIGGKVVMSNNGKTVFFGVIMAQTHSHFTQLSYKCYDYAYYLNKSVAVGGFKLCKRSVLKDVFNNGVLASESLKHLCVS